PQEKCREATLLGADGVVRSTTDYRWLEPTTPSARAREASRNLLDRAATPPLLRRGIRLDARLSEANSDSPVFYAPDGAAVRRTSNRTLGLVEISPIFESPRLP